MSNRRRTADNERQTVGRADVVPLSKKSAIRRRRPTVDRPLCRLLTDGGPPKFATWVGNYSKYSAEDELL